MSQPGLQRQTYQAFLERGDDGKFIGSVREVDQRFTTGSDDHMQALHILAHMITVWAHNNRLTRLPEPLPFLTERPAEFAVMADTEVAYLPAVA